MYYLKKDNKELYKSPLEDECFHKLLKIQSSSTSHAIKYEGYTITEEETDHEKKYRELAEKYHITITNLNLFDVEHLAELKGLLRKDEHLNNIPIRIFDNLSRSFLMRHRGSGFSLSMGVCLYKQALIRHANGKK